MPIDTIAFEGERYPSFQATGFAAQFAFPYAKKVCVGRGVDIGCGQEDWRFPGSIPVDPALGSSWHATDYPFEDLDYVFSSHTLEHLPNWVEAIEYWYKSLRVGGVIFLYLPHPSQRYWLPRNNRKHIHILHPENVRDCLEALCVHKIYVSGRDLNHSYMIMGEKKGGNCPVPT